ncbi:MAG: hypothetical protein HY509_05940 [Acidobacteria bacterium]|nr:hypothetical protein [Acidobacteriota bacterium]
MAERYRCPKCGAVWERDDLEEYAYDHEDGRIYLCPDCDTEMDLSEGEIEGAPT